MVWRRRGGGSILHGQMEIYRVGKYNSPAKFFCNKLSIHDFLKNV